jgi:hypothetical protein
MGKYTAKEQAYKTKKKLYELAKDNLLSFAGCTTGSFVIGLVAKYAGDGDLANPLVFGALSTPIVNAFQYFQGMSIDKIMKSEVGTIAGQTLGWTLASLL